MVFLADWQQFLLEPFRHCGRCYASAAIYIQERGNRREKLAAIQTTLALTLSACAPIPQQAPRNALSVTIFGCLNVTYS